MPQPHARRRPAVHVVSGKGGTGKTTVAAALALALAKRGRRVLAVEVEGRGGLAAIFEAGGEGEVLAATTADGGEVHVLDVDPRGALLQYLRLKVPVPTAAGVLTRVGAVDFATTVAPGVRDVIALGKVYEAARRAGTGRPGPLYDAVVVDAPPTGRVGRFLGSPAQVAAMAQVGPVRRQAERIDAWLRADAVVHLVTLLEELPVEETREAVDELATAGWRLGRVVVNRCQEDRVTSPVRAALSRTDAADTLRDELAGLGLEVSATTATTLLRQLSERAALEEHRAGLLRRLEGTLVGTGSSPTPLRHEPDGIDAAALARLAGQLGAGPEATS